MAERTGPPGPLITTYDDLKLAFGSLRISWALAVEDLKDRYRRSYIGLAWIILSFLAFILIKALVFSGVFDQSDYDFFSHLVIGFALFTIINQIITGGAALFVTNRTWILSTNQPYTLYANTLIIRGFAELALLAFASLILIGWMGQIHPAHLFTIPVALALYYLTGLGVCLLLAPIGVRLRDVIYAVQTVMRMMFFATPIIWVPTPGTIRGLIAQWNPLTYYLDIVRVPLIEGRFPALSWLVCCIITALVVLAGWLVFGTMKRRVPVWL